MITPQNTHLGATALASARLAPDAKALENVKVIFSQKPKVSSRLHFGCRIVQATDNSLFLTLGDRYQRMNDAQTLDNHHGKVVRVQLDGKPHPANPFLNRSGALPEGSAAQVATLDEVKSNIARFGMLDDRIEFCVGYFEQSLASLQGRRFAVIRLDSDSHDSVMSSLVQLYPLVSQGGIVIIDDWHLPGCRMAVEDYRAKHGIADPIQEVGGNAYWAKQQEYGQPG